jgi:hypothetical protein
MNAAAAILFAGHAIAQEALPCSRVITTEDMALQRFAQGPEGRVVKANAEMAPS